MIKPKKICDSCRKIKNISCICEPKPSHQGFKKNNYNLYNSSKWRKFAHKLRALNPLCKICMDEGRTNPCQMVDHIKPINSGGSIWDVNNLQCLCKKCHAIKSGNDK